QPISVNLRTLHIDSKKVQFQGEGKTHLIFLTCILDNEKVEVDKRSRAPKGHFVVYVGTEMTRFVIPTSFLNNPIFQQLLDKAAEEYGYNNQNRILLPCDEFTFQSLTKYLAKQCS
ncbi:hypothetical protein Godav_026037, partial [Gossypium davidsonii]|nr:hypothetical protein [Gossypium davidsonii]